MARDWTRLFFLRSVVFTKKLKCWELQSTIQRWTRYASCLQEFRELSMVGKMTQEEKEIRNARAIKQLPDTFCENSDNSN